MCATYGHEKEFTAGLTDDNLLPFKKPNVFSCFDWVEGKVQRRGYMRYVWRTDLSGRRSYDNALRDATYPRAPTRREFC